MKDNTDLWLKMCVMGCVLIVIGAMLTGARAAREQKKIDQQCILQCQTVDVTVVNGQCGCIFWQPVRK